MGTTKTPWATSAGPMSAPTSWHTLCMAANLAMESGYILSLVSRRTQRSWLPGQKKTRLNRFLNSLRQILSAFMVSPTSPAIMTTSFLKFSSLRPLTQPTLPCWSMWTSEIAKTLVRFLGNVESILNLSMARVPGLRLTWVSVMGTLGSREAAARQSSRASSHCPRPLQYTQYASSTFPRPSIAQATLIQALYHLGESFSAVCPSCRAGSHLPSLALQALLFEKSFALWWWEPSSSRASVYLASAPA
mmetsp:Transcript_9329/g.33446  ORF Transcript_9329/g.33446 Transcript_9329/m.33446 type:complete len:247 (+) Transcript_9329:510-1250(+)